MNREIKFRAWHTEQKRMIDVYGLGKDFMTENTLDGVDEGTNAFFGDDMNFINTMQYTGLKDKNGKEIYEGDIVNVYGWGQNLSDAQSVDIVWDIDENGWNFSDPNYTEDRYDFKKAIANCEIIGNIHENTEIL